MVHTWTTIMENYHSGDRYLKKKAEEWAIENLDKYVTHIIFTKYSMYVKLYLEDMRQEAYLAIMEALDKYEPSAGMPTTYFKLYIKGAIQRYVDYFVENTTTYYGLIYRKANRQAATFELEEKKYSYEDIAEAIGVSTTSVENAFYIHQCRQELDSSGHLQAYCDKIINEGRNWYTGDFGSINMKKFGSELDNLFECLTKKEAKVIKLWIGYETNPKETKEIAEELSLNFTEVKHIKKSATEKIKAKTLALAV